MALGHYEGVDYTIASSCTESFAGIGRVDPLFPDIQNLWHLDSIYDQAETLRRTMNFLISRWVLEHAQNLIWWNSNKVTENKVFNMFVLSAVYFMIWLEASWKLWKSLTVNQH